MKDKNGKEIHKGDQVIYANFLGKVADVYIDHLCIAVPEYRSLLLHVILDDAKEKVEIVTEQEATMFLLKRLIY